MLSSTSPVELLPNHEVLTIVCSDRRHPVGPGRQSQQLLCGPAFPCSRLFTPVGAVRGLVRVRVTGYGLGLG